MQARERVLSQSWISSTIWREGLRSRNPRPRPRPRVRAIGRALRAHFARPSRNAIESHLAGHQPASECTMRACMRESGRALGRRPVDMNGHVMSRSTYTSISMSTNPFIDMSIGAPAITARLISLHLISLRPGKVATGDRRAIKNGDATGMITCIVSGTVVPVARRVSTSWQIVAPLTPASGPHRGLSLSRASPGGA
jgi:hypothetical protein